MEGESQPALINIIFSWELIVLISCLDATRGGLPWNGEVTSLTVFGSKRRALVMGGFRHFLEDVFGFTQNT